MKGRVTRTFLVLLCSCLIQDIAVGEIATQWRDLRNFAYRDTAPIILNGTLTRDTLVDDDFGGLAPLLGEIFARPGGWLCSGLRWSSSYANAIDTVGNIRNLPSRRLVTDELERRFGETAQQALTNAQRMQAPTEEVLFPIVAQYPLTRAGLNALSVWARVSMLRGHYGESNILYHTLIELLSVVQRPPTFMEAFWTMVSEVMLADDRNATLHWTSLFSALKEERDADTVEQRLRLLFSTFLLAGPEFERDTWLPLVARFERAADRTALLGNRLTPAMIERIFAEVRRDQNIRTEGVQRGERTTTYTRSDRQRIRQRWFQRLRTLDSHFIERLGLFRPSILGTHMLSVRDLRDEQLDAAGRCTQSELTAPLNRYLSFGRILLGEELLLEIGSVSAPRYEMLRRARVRDLRRIRISDSQLTEEQLAGLLQSGFFSTATDLTIERMPLGSEAFARALGTVSNQNALQRVQRLSLPNTQLSVSAVRGLVQFAIPQLQYLNLSFNRLDADSMTALAGWSSLDTVTHLNLYRNNLRGPGFAALGRSQHLAALQQLILTTNDIDSAGALSFFTNARTPALREVDLRFNRVGDEAGNALIRNAARFPELRRAQFPAESSTLGLRERVDEILRTRR